jgi:hypothetical protein
VKADLVTRAVCNPIIEYPKIGYSLDEKGPSSASGGETAMPTDDSARLRAVVDQLANALQPAIVLAGQLHRTSSTTLQDVTNLEDALGRVVTILKTVQSNRPE